MKLRIAWTNKIRGDYNYGDWKEEKELLKLKKWIINQNQIYHDQYYWLEQLVNDKIKNFNYENEYYEYVKIN